LTIAGAGGDPPLVENNNEIGGNDGDRIECDAQAMEL
jgi:hypothetical protein